MKKKILLVSLLLITGLVTGCDSDLTSSLGGGSSTSSGETSSSSDSNSSSSETSSSSKEDSSSSSFDSESSSNSSSSSESSSSSSSSSSSTEVKKFEITPSNYNSSLFNYSNVTTDPSYANEFIIGSKGYISSTAFKGITKIVSSCYQVYNNLTMYSGTSSSGTLITPEESLGNKKATYTYNFTTPTDAFYLVNNNSNYRQYVYYIEIYYTGNTVSDSGSSGGNDSSNHKYTSFTSSEKDTFNNVVGCVIPFAPCDSYEIEDYEEAYEEDGYSYFGVCGFFYDLTQSEFNSYKNSITYTYWDSQDYEGDTYYYYEVDDYVVFMIAYVESSIYFDIYYVGYSGGSSGGSSGDSSGSFWDDVTNKNVLTNEGKGISSLINNKGYTDVDFSTGTKVKDVTEQSNYEGGCPTTGNVNVLVIPVEFSDCEASSKQDLAALDFALNGGSDESSLEYGMSVKTFYNVSSYGKLNLNFEIMGEGKKWYRPDNSSEYYFNQDLSASNSNQNSTADIDIVDSIMNKYGSEVDCSKYDADNNGVIDAVMIIPTVDINSDSSASILQWAYRYWAIEERTYDNVQLNDFLWCPYNFLFETDSGYNGKNATNNYTLIHEFGHILGADDYYDASYTNSATLLDGNDVMDAGFGDHNPYSKFNYGWLNSSRLVTASDSVTLELEAFEKAGDSIIVANNWDSTLGCYQEYWVLMYYTKESANEYSTYSFDEGIVMYHVNAQLIEYTYYGYDCIDIYTTNDQSSYYNTGVNLIELEKVNGSSYSLQIGQTSSASIVDDNNQKINYTFTLDSISNGVANITFNSNK